MRTIIAGGRNIFNMAELDAALAACGWTPTTVICGGASGADMLGKRWAEANNVPVEYFEADWATYSRAAGMYRNAQMAEAAEALIALWDSESRGTSNMITNARRCKLKIYVHLVKDQ